MYVHIMCTIVYVETIHLEVCIYMYASYDYTCVVDICIYRKYMGVDLINIYMYILFIVMYIRSMSI